MLEFERQFMCLKCRAIFVVQADFEQFYAIPAPSTCPGAPREDCDGTKFKCLQVRLAVGVANGEERLGRDVVHPEGRGPLGGWSEAWWQGPSKQTFAGPSSEWSAQEATGQPGACRDYQEIKIQEQVSKLAMGTIPRSMCVILEDDLVDQCKVRWLSCVPR